MNQPVTVTNLDRADVQLHGRLVNFSATGTRLILDQEIQPGAMVKIEWGGTILLGEIIYCSRRGKEFSVGLELEDALYEREMIASIAESWAPQVHGKR